MKIGIFHTSSTGCGIFVAKRMQEYLQIKYKQAQIDIQSINVIMHKVNSNNINQSDYDALNSYDMYIIGTFVDIGTLTTATRNFLLLEQFQFKGKKVVSFDTNGGGPGVTQITCKSIIISKGGIFGGHLSVKFYGHIKDKNYLQPIDPNIYQDIQNFVQLIETTNITDNLTFFQKWKILCHKVLTKLITSSQQRRLKIVTGSKIIIKEDYCDGCQICINNCPANVFDFKDNKAIISRQQDCYACLFCLQNCPSHAIATVKKNFFVQFKFHEYYINKKKGKVSVEELIDDYQRKQNM